VQGELEAEHLGQWDLRVHRCAELATVGLAATFLQWGVSEGDSCAVQPSQTTASGYLLQLLLDNLELPKLFSPAQNRK